MQLEQLEFGTLLEDSTNGNFEALFLGWSGRIDPDLNIYDFTVTDGDFNDSGYSNPEVDRLLSEARTTSDKDRRKELYGSGHGDPARGGALRLPLPQQPTTDFAMQPTVRGFEPYPDGILRLAGVSKQEQQ